MKNLFKILTREESVKTDNLMGVLSPFGEVEVIPDVEGNLEGYTGMCGDLRPEDFETRTTAWDLLFKDLAEEYTWVIEDDVAFNKKTIKIRTNRWIFICNSIIIISIFWISTTCFYYPVRR